MRQSLNRRQRKVGADDEIAIDLRWEKIQSLVRPDRQHRNGQQHDDQYPHVGGKLHPRFKPASDSLNIRNGVGVSADGRTAFFAISNRAVNFASFARLFRDGLGTPDALYFDGSVSRLYAPELGRTGSGFAVGPIVGLVLPKGDS